MDVYVTTIVYTDHATSAITTDDIKVFVDAQDGGVVADAAEALAASLVLFNAQLTKSATIRNQSTQLFSYA